MLYRILFNRYRDAFIETWDGVVIKATPSMMWCIDKDIESVIAWLERKNLRWLVQEKMHVPSLKELPTDVNLFKRVS